MDDENVKNSVELENNTVDDTSKDDQPQQQEKPDKAERTIEKLKKRIGKEQGAKHDAQNQLKDVLSENEQLKGLIEELRDGKKSIKDLADADKSKQADDAKDARIKELEAQLARNEALKETSSVFEESGFNVPDNVLNMVVSNDNEQTYANAQALIEFVQQVQTDAKKDTLKGTTPRNNGKATLSKADIAKIKDPIKRVEAIKENMDLFKH